jgi:hypothetical protein
MVRLLKIKFVAGLPFIRVTVREDGNQEKDQSLALVREISPSKVGHSRGFEKWCKGHKPHKTAQKALFY